MKTTPTRRRRLQAWLERWRARIAAALPEPDRNDVLQMVGAAAVAVGAGMIYRPAGVIVGGIIVFLAGVLGDLVPKESA